MLKKLADINILNLATTILDSATATIAAMWSFALLNFK